MSNAFFWLGGLKYFFLRGKFFWPNKKRGMAILIFFLLFLFILWGFFGGVNIFMFFFSGGARTNLRAGTDHVSSGQMRGLKKMHLRLIAQIHTQMDMATQ